MNFKKPLFWDEKRISLISILLFPFTIFFRLNNFHLKISKKIKPHKITSICIGNIYLGGTGKTPLVIKINEILSQLNFKVVIGKKFYDSQIDEIKLIKKRSKIITKKNRILIIEEAIKKKNNIIIFDDGLQDKSIDYNYKFVCFDAFNWIGNGMLLPSGPLREKLDSLSKYDAVFIKNISSCNKKIMKNIKDINPKIKIFNTKYKILNIEKFNRNKKFMIFSGIGNPKSFSKLLKKNKFKIIEEFIFPDHYKYQREDFINIIKTSQKLNAQILTTEKDYTKIPKVYHKEIKCLKTKLIIIEKNKLKNYLKNIK